MSFLLRSKESATEHFVVTHFDAYQDGTLAKTAKTVYVQHLKGCQQCREWVRRQEELVTRLESELAPAFALGPAASARIQQDIYHAMRKAVIMNNVRTRVAGAGALAVLVVAIGAVLWWQSGSVTTDVQEPASLQAPVADETALIEDAAPLSVSMTQQLDDFLTALNENGVVPFNGSVLVARGDEILLSKGYGMADAENRTPNTPQTRFPIGHMTQIFTGVAILQLQDQGQLTVDDPICQYLDTCPAAWETVTIHHLLSHSSGIADYLYEGGPLSEGSTPEQLVGRVIDLPLAFEPGSQFGFSSTDFVILGLILERVAGQPYLAYLQGHIFEPLEMVDTGADAGDGEMAVGYIASSIKARDVDVSWFFATGSLYSTIEDVYRFNRALQTGQLLSQAARDRLFAPYFSPWSARGDWHSFYANMGEGLFEGRRVWHNPAGGPTGNSLVAGFQTDVIYYPDDELMVVILENLDGATPFTTAGAIADRVLDADQQ
jgi:CubicO group peptidase (beta-lactamase class C family)